MNLPGLDSYLEPPGPEWEGSKEVECDADNVTLLVAAYPTTNPETKALMSGSAWHVEVEVEQCPFEGEVDAVVWDGVLSWTCPACNTEHTEEPDYGPDPDEERDLRREY